jgi:GLPGLI family protein
LVEIIKNVMRKIIYLAAFLFSSSGLVAQISEGVIIYERKINMHKRIQDEQMKAMIPEFRTSKHQLLFSDSTSMYKAVPEDEMPEGFGEGGGNRFVMRMGGDNGELYKNFAVGKSLESRELGAKTYIIEDSIRPRSWKLTSETKVIHGYTCRKAISTETMVTGGGMRVRMGGADNNAAADTANRPQPRQVTVEAWYAEGITAPVGPESYGMLPGVILELNIDNGSMTFSAVEIKKEVDRKEIKEPKKGKKVTREEFMKMMAELMPAGGGQRMIRM